MTRTKTWAVALTALLLACPAVNGAPVSISASDHTQNVFVFVGRYQSDFFGDSFRIFDNHYEDNFFAGLGYQKFLYRYGDVWAGVETGMALRLGASPSAEVWGGLVGRFDALHIGSLTISPAVTFGLSAETGTVGVETQRAADYGHGIPVLFYLGPEVSASWDTIPDLEVLARVQHRSGGFGIIAPVDGANAVTVGIRYKFN